MFMNIETLQWDDELLDFFGVDKSCLADIVSNGERYGDLKYNNSALNGTPIAGASLIWTFRSKHLLMLFLRNSRSHR